MKIYRFKGKPILILANKQDLPTAVSSPAQLRASLKLNEIGSESLVALRPCIARGKSSKDRSVENAIKWLITTVMEQEDQLSIRISAQVTEQKKFEAEEREKQRKRVEQYRKEWAEEEEKAKQDEVNEHDNNNKQAQVHQTATSALTTTVTASNSSYADASTESTSRGDQSSTPSEVSTEPLPNEDDEEETAVDDHHSQQQEEIHQLRSRPFLADTIHHNHLKTDNNNGDGTSSYNNNNFNAISRPRPATFRYLQAIPAFVPPYVEPAANTNSSNATGINKEILAY